MIRATCRALLRLFGWRENGVAPDVPKVVVIAAPHTSNWDFVLMLLMAGAFGLRISWMGKDALFRGPFGPVMRRLGGIPVERSARQNLVEQMMERFATSERLVLAVPPEATRRAADHWKSGFYHIALGADVPVAPSILDYGNKTGGFASTIKLTGDVSFDMDRFRAVYEGVAGKRPAYQGPIRLREEG